MSPEYAMHGHFSVKSDVFSFGVIVLEIVSGRRNSDFYQQDDDEDLLLSVRKFLHFITYFNLKLQLQSQSQSQSQFN